MTFLRDPCGIGCVVFTYAAVFYADYVIMRWIILQTMQTNLMAPVHVILFNTLVFLLCMSHLKAALSDPGIVPLPANRLDFSDMYSDKHTTNECEWSVCTRCETYRPPRAHHCRICKRCIRRMDHHCPWINNCVGERNQKYFLQFLVYVILISTYSIVMIIGSWVYPCAECNKNTLEAETRLIHTIILFFESALFGFFVVAVMIDQMHSILYDETAIEAKLQRGAYRQNVSKIHLLAEVFGRGHPAFWLLPCTNFNSSSHYYEEPLLYHDV